MTTTRLFLSATVRRNMRRKNSLSSFSSLWRKEHHQHHQHQQQQVIGTTRSRSFSSATALSSSQLQHFQKEGLLDETGRTQYETLHELQANACQIYADNPLFGTYQNEEEGFVWMTYQQFNQTVSHTRALLSHIGTCVCTCVCCCLLLFVVVATRAMNARHTKNDFVSPLCC